MSAGNCQTKRSIAAASEVARDRESHAALRGWPKGRDRSGKRDRIAGGTGSAVDHVVGAHRIGQGAITRGRSAHLGTTAPIAFEAHDAVAYGRPSAAVAGRRVV